MPAPKLRDPYRSAERPNDVQCPSASLERHVCALKIDHEGPHRDRTGTVEWGPAGIRYGRLRA